MHRYVMDPFNPATRKYVFNQLSRITCVTVSKPSGSTRLSQSGTRRTSTSDTRQLDHLLTLQTESYMCMLAVP